MIKIGLVVRSLSIAALAGTLLLTGCGGVPSGITEERRTPIPEVSFEPLGTIDPTASASPAPNMDLTPDTAVNSGMGESEKTETVRVTLHYITDEGYVLPVSERIEKQDGIARACLTRLIGSDDTANDLKSQGLTAPIPTGTSIALSIEDGEATVTLYGIGRLEDDEREQAMYASIVNTLTQFPSVQVVTIRFDGEKGENGGATPPRKCGTYALNPENNAIETGATGEASAITLYFPNESASLFVPITRYVHGKAGLTSSIAQLAAGTTLGGLRACFPENTLILGAAIENGVLSVNCSDDFALVSETPGMYSLAMQSVLLTARDFGSIDEIRFLVNGVLFEPEEDD